MVLKGCHTTNFQARRKPCKRIWPFGKSNSIRCANSNAMVRAYLDFYNLRID